jgi:Flp pilus assembly protein TadD
MDAKDLIAQGITLARRGQNEKAREMFNLALVADPRNENAWLWLSTVAIDDAEKEDCLRQVLAINPKNVNAANEQGISEKRRGELSAKVAALSAARSAIETPRVEAAAVPAAVIASRRCGTYCCAQGIPRRAAAVHRRRPGSRWPSLAALAF